MIEGSDQFLRSVTCGTGNMNPSEFILLVTKQLGLIFQKSDLVVLLTNNDTGTCVVGGMPVYITSRFLS